MANIDLNATKIYELTINKKRHCIEIKIVFSVNKTEEQMYAQFMRETLNFHKAMGVYVNLDAYADYLLEQYESMENKNTMPSKETDNVSQLIPNPTRNLVRKKIQNLIQFNNPILHLNKEGLFSYHQFVDNNNGTRGIIKDLERFYSDKSVNTSTTNECWLYNAIKALDLHWN